MAVEVLSDGILRLAARNNYAVPLWNWEKI
jgi:hypothetical protein